jgi:hypothetical protein
MKISDVEFQLMVQGYILLRQKTAWTQTTNQGYGWAFWHDWIEMRQIGYRQGHSV